MVIIASIVHNIFNLFILVIIVQTILSWVMSPYEPLRRTIDRIVEPFLSPIRRLVPPAGGTIDFSPMILIIILYILDRLIVTILLSFV